MFTVGAIIDRPQTTTKPKRATNGRPYKRISAEILFSLPNYAIMGLTKRLPPRCHPQADAGDRVSGGRSLRDFRFLLTSL